MSRRGMPGPGKRDRRLFRACRAGRLRRPWLVVMLREPVAGAVKTRLARDIGSVRAAWWYRHELRRLLRALSGDPRWELRLAVCPDAALRRRGLVAGLPTAPQGGGHLGVRMLRQLRSAAPASALVVGSDIPGVGRSEVARAIRALRRSDFVLGPSNDGGYWAIGARNRLRVPSVRLLDGVRWSSPVTLSDTLAALPPGNAVALADVLDDVDNGSDLAALCRVRDSSSGRAASLPFASKSFAAAGPASA